MVVPVVAPVVAGAAVAAEGGAIAAEAAVTTTARVGAMAARTAVTTTARATTAVVEKGVTTTARAGTAVVEKGVASTVRAGGNTARVAARSGGGWARQRLDKYAQNATKPERLARRLIDSANDSGSRSRKRHNMPKGRLAARKAAIAASDADRIPDLAHQTDLLVNAARRGGKGANRLVAPKGSKRRWVILVAILVVLSLLLVALPVLLGVTSSAANDQLEAITEEDEAATMEAMATAAGIPLVAFEAYWRASQAYPVDWAILAAIGWAECDHGRYVGHPDSADDGAGCNPRGTINSEGARGPMQFLGNIWRADADRYALDVSGPPIPAGEESRGYATDGNGDRIADPWEWLDATYSTARMLIHNGIRDDLRAALWNYNHVWEYVDNVIAKADQYRQAVALLELGTDGPIVPMGSTARYSEGGSITAKMQRLLDAVVPIFGQGRGIGCYRRASGGYVGEHPLGRACDFIMQYPLNRMPTPEYIAHGWQMANWLVEHHQEYGVMYVIWQEKVWSASRADEGWRRYVCGRNVCGGGQPNLQQLHYDHIHLSIYD